MLVEEALDYLGYEGKDKITGYTGIVTEVRFDLPGCIMVALTPKMKEGDKDLPCGRLLDINRIDKGDVRVMEPPNFVVKKEKPIEYSHGCVEPAQIISSY